MKVLVTGASGFVGSAFVQFARAAEFEVITPSRGELNSLESLLVGVDTVLHLAAIAQPGRDPAVYQAVNCDLAVSVAKKARHLGVKRFVFVSSSHAVTHADTPYGASKAAAERELMSLAGIEMVIARPAPVYGANAKGNFGTLLRLSRLPIPLPLAGGGRHSMVHIANLVDALAFLLTAPSVHGQIFIVTDQGPPLGVDDIVARLRRAMGRRPMLLSAPWLPGLLAAVKQRGLAEKLFGDQIVDGSALVAAGWRPPLTTEEGLARTARASTDNRNGP